MLTQWLNGVVSYEHWASVCYCETVSCVLYSQVRPCRRWSGPKGTCGTVGGSRAQAVLQAQRAAENMHAVV